LLGIWGGGGLTVCEGHQKGGGGVPQGRLYLMFIAFVLYNVVPYQTLQWFVYIHFLLRLSNFELLSSY
jgi:hypothetical protein